MANNYTRATVSPALPESLFTQSELLSLVSACGMAGERDAGYLSLFFDEHFSEEGVDDEGNYVNCVRVLQEKLRSLDSTEYPHIIIEGAATCDKMRQGEFGGFAYFITRDEERYTSTWQWLHEQTL